MPDRRVVVVTYNSSRDIAACLSALDGEDVLVIDNASSDGTVEIASHIGGRVEVVRNSTNVGFGAAANQGMRAVDRFDVALVNPDVLLTSQALDRLRSTAQRTGAGVVAPRLVNPNGTVQESARMFPSLPRLLARRTPIGRTHVGQRWLEEYLAPSRKSEVTEVDWVIGAVMYLPRSALDVLGGFDEDFFLYGEDVDLCTRSWRAGLPVVIDTSVTATHDYGRASNRTFDFRRVATRHHWVSILRLAHRYPRQFFMGDPIPPGKAGPRSTGALQPAPRHSATGDAGGTRHP